MEMIEKLDWNLLKSFHAVLETGSLSAAAKRLGASQPTIGRHIDELEAHFGATLFLRGRQGLQPTKSALLIADHVAGISIEADAIGLALAGQAASLEGTVRITASEIMATFVLPSILSDLLDQTPGLEIELVSSNQVENLTTREADIAVRMVRPEQPDLIARKVNELRIGMFATATYLEKHGTPERPEDLKEHLVVGYDKADMIRRGLSQHGLSVGNSFFRFRSDDQVACWMAVVQGLGIGFGPVHQAQYHPQMQQVGREFPIDTLPVWLVTHEELKTSRRIRHVYDFLAERLVAADL